MSTPSTTEKTERQEKEYADMHLENRLPENAALDANGCPTYAGMSGNKLIWGITAIASCGFTLFGYDQGVMSGLISAPQFLETFPACDPEYNNQGQEAASLWQALYVSLYEIGCLAGAVVALGYGDRLGRRRMIKIGAYIMIVGVVIQVTAFRGHMAGHQFVIGRIITGVGNGMNTATIPTWHAETSKSHNRGLLVCIEASTIATGTAISYWIDFGFSFDPSSLSWRIPIALQCVFAAVLLAGVHYLPESPRWLISNGQIAEGQRVVAALEPAPYHSDETILATRVILESLEGVTVIKKSDLLTSGPTQHLRRMLIGASSQIMQQIGGCNAIIYFAPVIYKQNLGLSPQLALILGGVNVTVYAFAAFASFPLIERIGRRNLFLIGSAGQALSMFIIMGCLIQNDLNIIKGAVFGLFLYLIFFGFTWLELPWLYPAEINPLRTRTNANAVSTICSFDLVTDAPHNAVSSPSHSPSPMIFLRRLFNFAVVLITPILLTAINWGTFLIFGIINVCFIPVIYIFYPETSGRSLEEIDIIFATAYLEKRSYVEVAKNLPSLSNSDIEAESHRLGLDTSTTGTDLEKRSSRPALVADEKASDGGNE